MPRPRCHAWIPATTEEESTRERINRNWNKLLQELRVAQTRGADPHRLLLMLPFQPGFKDLADTRTYVCAGVLLVAVTVGAVWLVLPCGS